MTKMMREALRLADRATMRKSFSTSAAAERRGRLVHDDQARLHRERAGDLDHLLLGDGQVAHRASSDCARGRCRSRDRLASRRPVLRQLTKMRGPGSRPMKTFSAIVMFGRERELLVDGDDAERAARRAASRRRPAWPSKLMLPASGCLRAGQDLQQRRLAGAVLAEQRMDLARADLEMRRRRAPARRGSAC